MLKKEDYEYRIKKTEEMLSNLKKEYNELIRSEMSETINRVPDVDADENTALDAISLAIHKDSIKNEGNPSKDYRKIMQDVLGFSNEEIDNILDSKRKERAIFKEIGNGKELFKEIRDRKDLAANIPVDRVENFEFIKANGVSLVRSSNDGNYYRLVPVEVIKA